MQTEHYLYWLTCYLIGALPFGLLVAKAKGINIREVGSGNIGATNVFRTVGKGWGLFTFALDAAKGALPVSLLATAMLSDADVASRAFGGFCAIAGHNWPVYLKFKGGKGVATSAGVLLGLTPATVGIGLIAWVVSFLLSRYVSVASMAAGIAVGIAVWPLHVEESFVLPILVSLLAILIVARHKSNIQRLCAGTENRFEFKKKTASESSST